MRIGIELECWTVDPDGRLAAATEVADACEWVDREFVEPLLEVKTPPCDSVGELSAELADRLERVVEVAREHDRRLVPLGTPLGDTDPPMRETPRTAVQRAVLGDALTHATHCAGTHVHFEQERGAVTDQLRVLTALDPAFALVNTSPYYRGRRVATCARPLVYRRRCYDALPTHGQLWAYPQSTEEWRERVDDRFETFVDAAREAGVARERVTEHFSPADAVWSPVRLRDDLGTVEWRAPDAVPPGDLLDLVADVTRVVETAADRGTEIADVAGIGETVSLPPFEDLRRRVDEAMARGLSSAATRAYLDAMGLDVDAYRPVSARIDGERRLDAETVRRLRLRTADRFERTVRDRSLGDTWRPGSGPRQDRSAGADPEPLSP